MEISLLSAAAIVEFGPPKKLDRDRDLCVSDGIVEKNRGQLAEPAISHLVSGGPKARADVLRARFISRAITDIV